MSDLVSIVRAMSSKARRRRRQQQERQRQQQGRRRFFEEGARDEVEPPRESVACADADLALIDVMLDEVLDVLTDLRDVSAGSYEEWPDVPQASELRAVFDSVRTISADCRSKLFAARDRVERFKDGGNHLHVIGERVVQLAVVDAEHSSSHPDDDIPF